MDTRQLMTLILAAAIGGLIVVWLTPYAKRLPPRDTTGGY